MTPKKDKKEYVLTPDLVINHNPSKWDSYDDGEFPPPSSFDIDMPIHPDYIQILQPEINIGDLVETHRGKVGIVVSEKKPEGVFITIKNANNKYYNVLIGEKEERYIGYSLKKIEENS